MRKTRMAMPLKTLLAIALSIGGIATAGQLAQAAPKQEAAKDSEGTANQFWWPDLVDLSLPYANRASNRILWARSTSTLKSLKS